MNKSEHLGYIIYAKNFLRSQFFHIFWFLLFKDTVDNDSDFRNIFDDNFYKKKPETLLDYAKQFDYDETKQPVDVGEDDDDTKEGEDHTKLKGRGDSCREYTSGNLYC